MKFTLNRSTALGALNQALKTVNTKAKNSNDADFYCTLEQGVLQISSITDTADQIISVPVRDADGSGKFLVNAQALVEYVKSFPDNEIVCQHNADREVLYLSSTVRQSKVAFPTYASRWVPFEFKTLNREINCDGSALAQALKSTAFATATDGTAAPLTSVKVTLFGDVLVAESSDGNRVSVFTVQIDDVGLDKLEFLIPRQSAEMLSSMLDGVETVIIEPGQRHIRFRFSASGESDIDKATDKTIFTSSLENGLGDKFPDLGKFISGAVVASLKVSRADLLGAIKRAALFVRESYINVGLSEDGLFLSCNNQDKGAIQEVVVAQEFAGSGSTIVVCKYLQKALEVATNPWIVLELRSLPNGKEALLINDEAFQHMMFPIIPKADDEQEDDTETVEEDEDDS